MQSDVSTQPPRKRSWMAIGFAVMAAYLGVLGFVVVFYGLRLADIVNDNRRRAEVAEAQHCIDDHKRVDGNRAGNNVIIDGLEKAAAGQPDVDQTQVSIFIADLRRDSGEKLATPACDLDEARATLDRLGVEPE